MTMSEFATYLRRSLIFLEGLAAGLEERPAKAVLSQCLSIRRNLTELEKVHGSAFTTEVAVPSSYEAAKKRQADRDLKRINAALEGTGD